MDICYYWGNYILCFLIDSSGPASTIADDIRQADAYYGYGTKYEIGQVEKVRCSEQEKDGQGRFIIQCAITYYPKRVNGTIAMDSKSSETIYAVYLKLDGKNFLDIIQHTQIAVLKARFVGEDQNQLEYNVEF